MTKFYLVPENELIELIKSQMRDEVAEAYAKNRYHEMPVVLFPPDKEFKND